MAEKNIHPDSYFKKSLTKWIVKPLREYDFFRYKTAFVGRVTNDSIFQFINLQKDAYGGKTFTVNVGVRPLFIPHDYLSLQPGQRIGYFKYGADKWWSFKTEDRADHSFIEVNHIINDYVLEWFEQTSETNGLINLYTDSTQERIIPTSLNWRFFDLGHLYARQKQYGNAIDAMETAQKYFRLQPFAWCTEASEKCGEFIGILNKGESEVDDYLKNSERISKINLGLDK
ncbi:DUF4304 domain-containing protein [Mesobacillus jeotgali]|uniref:DUF4304 domain-containing protein n=1 Tax=Mesobacillus jeotgali TaxID=129985 RepID=A0ABY9VIP1_9BACI|nr:DUF4304 domain-containing protein [Mesobacillus jeotgali]WNF22686.1 DUF4304 domain-containing protein [Mesobacillus jeotgali]